MLIVPGVCRFRAADVAAGCATLRSTVASSHKSQQSHDDTPAEVREPAQSAAYRL